MKRLKLRHESYGSYPAVADQVGSWFKPPDAVLEQGLKAGGFSGVNSLIGRRQCLPDLQGGLVGLSLLSFIQSI